MIAHLRGTVLEAWPNRLVVDVGGVGYLVHIPISTSDKLHPVEGAQIELKTHFHVRENAQILYGFATNEERDVFLLLIERVSGIGPAMAMSVLSGMPVTAFKQAVADGDAVGLSRVKGIGKKTAERIVLELKDKVGVGSTWETPSTPANAAAQDAELALLALGYKQTPIQKALAQVLNDQPTASTEELIREALRHLT